MYENKFDNISPVDYRYRDEEVAEYLSERNFLRYKLFVELALIKALCQSDICDEQVLKKVQEVILKITPEEVFEEEKRIGHDIRALVNCIRQRVSDDAKPFIHLTATSSDIVNTANLLRYIEVVDRVVVPLLKSLEKVLIKITLREADTLQIGRTHGQHAVPITFGFAMAEYVSRLGKSILMLERFLEDLSRNGKFSGAVGAYNASSLLFDDPEMFEERVLAEGGLIPSDHSTQIMQPEPLARLFNEMILIGGILANLSRDMRNLQRTEIGEIFEEFKEDQVGSSTMPQKRNPINFENTESLWKVLVGRYTTILMDQISDHQRDLTNSASARTYVEIVSYLVVMIKRLIETMEKIRVDKENLKRNFELSGDLISAEPLYVILSSLGYPDAHEKVRKLTLESEKTGRSLKEIINSDEELTVYFSEMESEQKEIIFNPTLYTGISPRKARKIADMWEKRLKIKNE